MNVTNTWYSFEGELDKTVCNKIIQLGENKWEDSLVDIKKEITNEERISGRVPDLQSDPNMRKCSVAWLGELSLYDVVFPYARNANDNSGWKYDIPVVEKMQLTRYSGGEFYNFHRDGNGDHLSAYNNPKDEILHGYVRKLSMSIILNDDCIDTDHGATDTDGDNCSSWYDSSPSTCCSGSSCQYNDYDFDIIFNSKENRKSMQCFA